MFWIGTHHGLYRFDGLRLKHYQQDPDDSTSLSGPLVLTIFEDFKGYLWVGTNQNGLNRMDPETGKFKRYYHNSEDANTLSSNNITEVFEDSKHRLWVGTWGSGLNLFDRDTESFRHFTLEEGDQHSIISNDIFDICEDETGLLWFATSNGVCSYDPELDQFQNLPNSGTQITSLQLDQEQVLWAGSWDGPHVYRINRRTRKCQLMNPDPSNGNITDMLLDRENNLWITLNYFGLSKFNREKNIIDSLEFDKSNPFWPFRNHRRCDY
ncbi:MAG TPA: hypothetical protein EYQ50_08090 [Verrucomicrobiales bacterium]|nr:hypothetical protein [Verrucomicrobiales bacterium]